MRFLFVYCLSIVFTVPAEARPHSESLNEIIQIYRQCNLDCLESSFSGFSNRHSTEKTQVLEVIYQVLLAEKYSKQFESKNSKSEALYTNAIALAKKLERDDLTIWSQTQFGYYYYQYTDLIKALPHFLRASRKIESSPSNRLLEAELVLKQNGYFFGLIEDYKKEERYLKEAIQFTDPNSENHTELLNSIGSSFLKQKQLNKAEHYFIETRDLALKNKHHVRYAKALGELAKIHALKGDLITAKTLLEEDIAVSKQNRSDRNTMYAQIQLGKILLLQENFKDANIILNDARNYVRYKVHLASYEYEITELLLTIAIHKKNINDELNLRRDLHSLNKVVSITDGQPVIDRLNTQAQKEQIESELEIEQTKLEKASLLQLTWIVASILLLIIAVLTFIIYQRKLKLERIVFNKNILSLQLKQIQSEKKLNDTRATLNSYQIYLSEKNIQLTQLEQELKSVPLASKVKNDNQQKLWASHLMTQENWLRFKAVFITEEPDYYNYIIENFPGLTENNLRIILLQKIGLNNLETAQTIGITTDAVKKAKQRLQKKYAHSMQTLEHFSRPTS